MTRKTGPHRQLDGVSSPSLILRTCSTCTVRVTYRPVRDQWRTFVTHEEACPHKGQELTPAGWGRIE